MPGLESQLRQHTPDFPLGVILTVWACNSSYHPKNGHLIRRVFRAEVRRTYGSGPHTSTRTFFLLIFSSSTFGCPLVQRFEKDHDQDSSGILRAWAMDDLSILPIFKCLAILSGAGALDGPFTNSRRRRSSGCATAKSIKGCKKGKGGSSSRLRDA